MPSEQFKESVSSLEKFFALDVCQRATKPLKEGIEIAIYVADEGPVSLIKIENQAKIITTAPKNPDMSFWIGPQGIKELMQLTTSDIGEVGIAIIKLMLSKDPNTVLKAKVHIGTFSLLRNGYLGVLPLGGSTVMKFLATKGFTNIGKIKDAISSLRG